MLGKVKSFVEKRQQVCIKSSAIENMEKEFNHSRHLHRFCGRDSAMIYEAPEGQDKDDDDDPLIRDVRRRCTLSKTHRSGYVSSMGDPIVCLLMYDSR